MSDFLERSEAEQYASWFKALADATRIQIVTLLARGGAPMTVGEIVAAVAVGQSTVSHHLKGLTEVGFVLVEREGFLQPIPAQRGVCRGVSLGGRCRDGPSCARPRSGRCGA